MRPVCLDAIYQLAKQDPRVVFIGSDIGYNLIDAYRRELPDQFFIDGISEQNLVGVAAGMAHAGKIVYLASIACFFSRAYEQIKLDVALPGLPVRFVGFGAGLTYGREGPTHMALDDIGLFNLMGINILAPADKAEMAVLIRETVDYPGPLYIRLGDLTQAILGLPLFPDYSGTRAEILAHYGIAPETMEAKVKELLHGKI